MQLDSTVDSARPPTSAGGAGTGASSLIAKTRRPPSAVPAGYGSTPLVRATAGGLGSAASRTAGASGGAAAGVKYEHSFEPRGVRPRMRLSNDGGEGGSAAGSTSAARRGGTDEQAEDPDIQARIRKWYQLLQVGRQRGICVFLPD